MLASLQLIPFYIMVSSLLHFTLYRIYNRKFRKSLYIYQEPEENILISLEQKNKNII